jgi:hypothetical protein
MLLIPAHSPGGVCLGSSETKPAMTSDDIRQKSAFMKVNPDSRLSFSLTTEFDSETHNTYPIFLITPGEGAVHGLQTRELQ